MEKLKVVITGHVDHGKSSLIGRILYDTKSILQDKMSEVEKMSKAQGTSINFAYFTDHLLEEREQNITIETTQTFFKTGKREYVIIDAPGHKEFITNMVTGASQAEVAILIVDVLEGCKEQTKRHAYILSLLGIKKVILAVNKMDAAKYNEDLYDKVAQECRNYLHKLDISEVYSVPISAVKGDNVSTLSVNMPWYIGEVLLDTLDSLSISRAGVRAESIFSIQDIYNLSDKSVCVGRVEYGSFKVNDEVMILPAMKKTVIQSMEKFLEKKIEISAGECAGLVIKDDYPLKEGNVIASCENSLIITDTLIVHLFWMNQNPVKKGEQLLFQCSTQKVTCTLIEIRKRLDETITGEQKEEGQINCLDICEVLLKTEGDVIVSLVNEPACFGRFVLVMDKDICGWGTIVDMKPAEG